MPDPTQHSPLGGSGAYRWMPCPGSVALSHGVPDEESEYAAVGTAAHTLAAWSLTHRADAWEWMGCHASLESGELFHPDTKPADLALLGGTSGYVTVDKEMADAVQVYLNAVRSMYSSFRLGFDAWVEHEFHCPEIHELCWGKIDFAYLNLSLRALDLWDYKHGVGVVVEVIVNPQLMYYACGTLTELNLWDEVDIVNLHVAQPRGFHHDGPIRSWSISTSDLLEWMLETLVPAMKKALTSRDTASGEHCRFCPARARACPQLLKDFDELEEMLKMFNEKDAAPELTHAQVGRFLDLLDVAKIAGKAAGKIGFGYAMAGEEVPGRKLVKAKANREWKDGAEGALQVKFGNKIYTEPELKSPSQIEKLPRGEKMIARHAFKPDKGLTLVRADDTRMVVNKNTKAMFEDKTKEK